MRSVKFNDLATEALEYIAFFIVEESHSIDIALNFVNKLRKRVRNRLETFPKSGKFVYTINGIDYLEIIVDRYIFTYKIEYIDNVEIIHVVDVIHEKQDR